MSEILLKAVEKAQKHIDRLSETSKETESILRKELKKLSKDELIEKIVAESRPKTNCVKIETVVYAILADPDCAWLTWDTIANLIRAKVPESKTTAKSLQWYPSQGIKDGRTIVPRKPVKEIAALLINSI